MLDGVFLTDLHLSYLEDESLLHTREDDDPPVQLHDCLLSFAKKEHLSGSERWYGALAASHLNRNCPDCKKLSDLTKELALTKLPNYLVVHLKRFEYIYEFRSKLTTLVNYPVDNLDMSSFLQGQDPQLNSTYHLYGVVVCPPPPLLD